MSPHSAPPPSSRPPTIYQRISSIDLSRLISHNGKFTPSARHTIRSLFHELLQHEIASRHHHGGNTAQETSNEHPVNHVPSSAHIAIDDDSSSSGSSAGRRGGRVSNRRKSAVPTRIETPRVDLETNFLMRPPSTAPQFTEREVCAKEGNSENIEMDIHVSGGDGDDGDQFVVSDIDDSDVEQALGQTRGIFVVPEALPHAGDDFDAMINAAKNAPPRTPQSAVRRKRQSKRKSRAEREEDPAMNDHEKLDDATPRKRQRPTRKAAEAAALVRQRMIELEMRWDKDGRDSMEMEYETPEIQISSTPAAAVAAVSNSKSAKNKPEKTGKRRGRKPKISTANPDHDNGSTQSEASVTSSKKNNDEMVEIHEVSDNAEEEEEVEEDENDDDPNDADFTLHEQCDESDETSSGSSLSNDEGDMEDNASGPSLTEQMMIRERKTKRDPQKRSLKRRSNEGESAPSMTDQNISSEESVNIHNTGEWTEEEIKLFHEGVKEFGNKWKKISKHYVKTRNRAQIKRFAYLLGKTKGEWTREEHERFMAGLQAVGPNFPVIAREFVKTRSFQQVRTRFIVEMSRQSRAKDYSFVHNRIIWGRGNTEEREDNHIMGGPSNKSL